MPIMLSLALVACSNDSSNSNNVAAAGDQPAAVAEHDMTPEQLGELGAQISKQPDQAKQLLSQHGMDEKSFEAKIRKITEDPAASKRYAEAFEKAKA